MESIKTHVHTFLTIGEDLVDKNPTACMAKYMRQLEAKFGGSRAAWFLAVAALISIVLFLIGGNALIANIVGFLYPAFASFKAIDSPDAHASAQWMSYWTIFGAFVAFEDMCWMIIPAIPYYHILKAITLIYSFHPLTKGATLVYDNILRPIVIQHVLPGSSSARGHSASPAAAAASAVSAAASAVGSAAADASGALSRGIGGIGGGGGAAASTTPRAVTVPEVSDLVSPPSSDLRVVVISASDVVPTEAPGVGVDCDPYCVLEVLPEGTREKDGAAENTKYKTVCKMGTANPVWNEGITIPQVQHLDAKLVVTVCNKRAMGRDQCLGKIEVPLSDDAVRGGNGPADIVKSLSPAEGSDGPAMGDLRVTVLLN